MRPVVRGRRVEQVQRAESIAAELCARKSCRDPLFDLRIAEAANACCRNAASLLRDGRLLVQSSPARTLSLSVLSLEELAKIPALFEVGPETGSAAWGRFWKDFASHRFKQEAGARYGQLFEAKGSE
jgi:hypothetical protein